MTHYTLVDESYEVEIYTSLNKLLKRYNYFKYMFLEQDNQCPMKLQIFRKQLKEETFIRLYEENFMDWKYKIQKHT